MLFQQMCNYDAYDAALISSNKSLNSLKKDLDLIFWDFSRYSSAYVKGSVNSARAQLTKLIISKTVTSLET
eukprot:snap_masked-scaffold_12-processed-gene-1.40-mRNA-1 protein AED:1.00 eAED:1.00 QI:0/0/0/0/1/1/2/0/70